MRVAGCFFRHLKPCPKKKKKRKRKSIKKLFAVCGNRVLGVRHRPSAHALQQCEVNYIILNNSLLRSLLRRQHRDFFHRPRLPLHYWRAEVLFALRMSLCQEWSSHFCIISLWPIVMFSEACWPSDAAAHDGVTGLHFRAWAAISLLGRLLTPLIAMFK